jgi:signal transduction histidine kinase/ActR/RegA family two-component response regulator
MLRDEMGGLRRDPVFVAALVTVASLAVVEFALRLPAAVADSVSWYSDFLLLALLIFGSCRALRTERSSGGRRFWWLVTVSFGLWFGVLLVWECTTAPSSETGSVITDCLFLCGYFALILATAVRPHVRREQPVLTPLVVTEMVGGAVLAFGLLAYFVVLPSRLTPHAYATFTPSLSLYVLLDVVLLSRLVWWSVVTVGSRWRRVYIALAAGLGFTLLHDIHELLVYSAGQTLRIGFWEFVWWGQFIGLIAAVCLARHEVISRVEAAATPDVGGPDLGHQAVLGPVASYAFVLPVVHLGAGLAGVLDPALDKARETLVLFCALVLGGLAVTHHELMDRRYRATQATLHDARILLQQSRKMEALGRLAGGIAHGFNNLLSVIIGYAELLSDRLPPGEGLHDPVLQIRQAAERAASLTHQLAIFSRGQLGHDEPFEVDQALETLMPTLRQLLGERVAVTVRPGTHGSWVGCDVHQFERALLNVAANARDAMPEGGTFRIATRDLMLREGLSRTPGLLPAGAYVQITLSDTGVGMDEEVRSQVFEPFFTTRHDEGHRGLGLSLAYGVVRQAGGHIDIDSLPGRGTTLDIYLPQRVPSARPQATETGAPSIDRPVTVLLAEDERGLRRLMKASLEGDGFTVLEAADGRTAVDIAEQHCGRIDLLLSDVVMPGYTGPEVAARVVADRPETRVMFVSGYAPETLGDLRVAGAETLLLAKPFTMDDLSDRVKAVLAGRASASA